MNRPLTPIFFLLFLYFSANLLNAQNMISGTLIDENDSPISYAEIIISANDSIITSEFTNNEGNFSIDLSKGSYVMIFNYYGNEVLRKKIFVQKPVDLGKLKLDLRISLGEVIIKSKLINKKGDKLVMSVSGNKLLKGRNTLEVLKYAPYLSVDSNSGSISMKGKATTILVNGRNIQAADIQTYLSTLPSENIASVEIISNPSSRYDASGGGGVINIITKNPNKGIVGSLNSRIDVSKFTSYNSHLTLNSKLSDNLIVNTSLNYNDNKGLRKENRIETLLSPSVIYDYDKIDTLRSNYFYLSTEAIYDISKRNQIGFGIAYSDYNNRTDQSNDLIIKDDNEEMFSKGNYLLKRERNYLNLNLNHTIKLDTIGQNIKTIIDYYNSDINSNNSYQNLFFENSSSLINSNQRLSNSPISNKIFSLKSDYVKPFNKSKLELGGKYSSVNSKSETVFRNLIESKFVIDDNLTNDFNYKEQILAGYILYAIDDLFLKSNISLQLGTRFEYTRGIGKIPSENYESTRNYLDFFPSLFLTKDFGNNNNLSFSYTRRIDRPSYNSFNPTIFYLTDFTSQIGNPELQPSYTNAFELSYNTSNINILAYCNLTQGEPREILKRIDESNIQYQWRNIDNSDVYGISFSGEKTIIKDWLSILAKASVYNKIYKSSFGDDVDSIEVSKTTFQGRMSLSAKLLLEIKSEFAFEYNGSEMYGQFETVENYAFYLNFSKKFNKNFSTYLKITDVFDNLRYTFKNNQSIVQTHQFRNNFSTNYSFSVVYTFGIGSNVRKQNLKNSNRDLRNRTN